MDIGSIIYTVEFLHHSFLIQTEETGLGHASKVLRDLSASIGTGNPMMDLFILLLGLAVVVLIVGLLALFLTSSGKNQPQGPKVDRMEAMIGRLERTERTLHEFKSDILRSLELSRNELEFIRTEFQVLRDMFETKAPTSLGDHPVDEGLVVSKPRKSSREDIAQDAAVWSEPQRTSQSPNLAPRSQVVTTQAPPALPSGSQPPAEPLASRLQRTRKGFFERIRSVFTGKPKLDDESVADLEAILIGSDIGIKTVSELLAELKQDVANGTEVNEGGLTAILKLKLLSILQRGTPLAPIVRPKRREDGPLVVLVVGVNGAGKTTTVAKLAHQWKDEGSKVLMVAADTFRAAAVEQLHEWGRRLGIEVTSGPPSAKPATVVFDAVNRAKEDPETDVVIIDTAGRLHTKQSLMDELSGIRNAVERHMPGAPHETLLVVDGSTGQNAVTQAREFHEATKLTGLIVTKLDGTSKGGVVVAIKEELGIAVRYIGVGEGKEDLRPFVPRDFVEALFDTSQDAIGSEGGVNAEIRRERAGRR